MGICIPWPQIQQGKTVLAIYCTKFYNNLRLDRCFTYHHVHFTYMIPGRGFTLSLENGLSSGSDHAAAYTHFPHELGKCGQPLEL
jgi:hypothetical protein